MKLKGDKKGKRLRKFKKYFYCRKLVAFIIVLIKNNGKKYIRK